MDDSTAELELPGFRFHPTEEELLEFYLKNILLGKKLHYDIIGFLNIYHHDPWELPGLARLGEREWYFFVPRDRKHGSGGRPNRTTKTGFWKATGSDRRILSLSNPKKMIGLKKTLVFYKGRAPRGCKTDWIMNEYRQPDTSTPSKDVVLCKIYRKATSLRVLEQRAAIEEATKAIHAGTTTTVPSSPPMDAISSCSRVNEFVVSSNHAVLKKEAEELLGLENEVSDSSQNSAENNSSSSSSAANANLELQKGKTNLTELQVPKNDMDWTQDPLWTQLRSPWLDILTPGYANILNF